MQRADGIDLCHDRSHRSGIPRLLCRLRQRRAVAAAAFPPRPGQFPARGLRGLSRGQPAVRRSRWRRCCATTTGLGARLPPDPAGRGTAPARRAQPHRLLPAHAVRAAGAAAGAAARGGAAARDVRLRRGGLPDADLSAARSSTACARSSAITSDRRRRVHATKAVACVPIVDPIGIDAAGFADDRRPRRPQRRDAGDCAKAWAAARSPSASTGSTIPRAWSSGSRHSAGCSRSTPSIGGRSASCRSRRGRARSPAATSVCGASSTHRRPHQRPVLRVRLGAAALHDHARCAGSCLPGSSGSPGSALVTPLRDGMNLVAKEYVAAQDPTIPACWSCRASPARPRS